MNLSHRQRDCLNFLKAYIAENDGISPSYDEIKDHLKVGSRSVVHRLCSALEQRGYIERVPRKSRAITLTRKTFGYDKTDAQIREDERERLLGELEASAVAYECYTGRTAIQRAVSDLKRGALMKVTP